MKLKSHLILLATSILMLTNLFWVSCAHLLKADYNPVEVCEAVCLINGIVEPACVQSDNYLAHVYGAYSTFNCMDRCDNNFDVFAGLDPECLLSQYISTSTQHTCPDIASCF